MQTQSLVLLSNQAALQRSLDVVANNIANSSTTAFKRQGIEFATSLVKPGGQSVAFVSDRATYRDTATGPINPTHNPLDIAIQGKGYLSVNTSDGKTHYTRNGALQVNNQGQLATASGLPILSDGGQPITLPETTTEVNISGDGFVTVRVDNGVNLSQIGKIGLVSFEKEQQLQAEGGGLYTTNQPSKPVTDASIVQGSLEQSNVEPVTEMTQMIKIMRAYENASRLIGMDNTRMTDAIDKLSKTTA